MKLKSFVCLVAGCFSLVLGRGSAAAQGTAFMYQGRLNLNGAAANGSFDLACALFTTNISGSAVGTITNAATAVNNGLFTLALDFGSSVFNGTNYWLEIAVRTNGGGGFVVLNPRQPLMPVPYAIFATTASLLNGTLSAGQISGSLPGTKISGAVTNSTYAAMATNSPFGALGTAATNPANAFAPSSVTNLTPLQLTALAAALTNNDTRPILVRSNITITVGGTMLDTVSPAALGVNQAHDSQIPLTTMTIDDNWTIPPNATNILNSLGAEFRNFSYGSNSAGLALLNPVKSTATHRGTGNFGSIYGFQTHLGNQSSSAGGGGVLTNVIGYYSGILDVDSNSPIVNAYGFFSAPQTASAVTRGYGFYQQGSLDLNEFEGAVKFDKPFSQNITINSGYSLLVNNPAGSASLANFNGGGGLCLYQAAGNVNWYVANASAANALDGSLYFRFFSTAQGAFVDKAMLSSNGVLTATAFVGTHAGNGSGLTNIPAAALAGITTNYTLPSGPTLYITNGLIMGIH
ncbi:MAG: hypothetical protein WCS42_22625 [Verrucomicrobiota bacterium]